MIKLLISATLAAVLAGCTTIGSVARNAEAPAENEGFFLVGIKPHGAHVAFDPRLLQNGALYQNLYRGVSFTGKPEDGYIMGRTNPDDLIVFAGAALTLPDGTKKRAISCGGNPGMTFTALAGKVIYPGDVIISEENGKLHVKMEFNPDAARKVIEQKFPAMKDRLVIRPFIFRPDKRVCGNVVVTYR